jgi:methionyl-tRNA synthetase
MFPRIDVESKIEELNKIVEESIKAAQKPTMEPVKEEITIEDFEKIDMRVVKVLECVPMKKTKKLLKLKVDLGGEIRQVISGIAEHYKPEDLVGKYVVLVANLKPVTLRGELSQGMIISAATEDDKKLFAVTVPSELPTGTIVR